MLEYPGKPDFQILKGMSVHYTVCSVYMKDRIVLLIIIYIHTMMWNIHVLLHDKDKSTLHIQNVFKYFSPELFS